MPSGGGAWDGEVEDGSGPPHPLPGPVTPRGCLRFLLMALVVGGLAAAAALGAVEVLRRV